MMITNNNLNFKGYKNFLGFDSSSPNGSRASYFTLQLNDEGNKDLSEFREILKLMGRKDKELENDVINYVYVQAQDGSGCMFLNKYPLYDTTELKKLACKMPKSEYIKEERCTIKAYTLLANLTKRMMHNDLITHDAGMNKVITTTMECLGNIFNNDSAQAFHVIQMSCANPPKANKLGTYINTTIHKEMVKFFK